jgi:hypothetical protein
MDWQILILSLPSRNATARQRAWRALKSVGAASLRDGVYLLPASEALQVRLQGIANDVRRSGGDAHWFPLQIFEAAPYRAMFARTQDYTELMEAVRLTKSEVGQLPPTEALKRTRKLRSRYEAIRAIDFFPEGTEQLVLAELTELESSCARLQAPDEPQAADCTSRQLSRLDYQGRVWATRQRPWIDRLASAWLIRRFIDPRAAFRWLVNERDRPDGVVGFDYDGAEFSHVGSQVTFEVLAASFGLAGAAIDSMSALVHYLDVGGRAPPEAAGAESILAGLRRTIANDDQLLDQACAVLDALFATFSEEAAQAVDTTNARGSSDDV